MASLSRVKNVILGRQRIRWDMAAHPRVKKVRVEMGCWNPVKNVMMVLAIPIQNPIPAARSVFSHVVEMASSIRRLEKCVITD